MNDRFLLLTISFVMMTIEFLSSIVSLVYIVVTKSDISTAYIILEGVGLTIGFILSGDILLEILDVKNVKK